MHKRAVIGGQIVKRGAIHILGALLSSLTFASASFPSLLISRQHIFSLSICFFPSMLSAICRKKASAAEITYLTAL